MYQYAKLIQNNVRGEVMPINLNRNDSIHSRTDSANFPLRQIDLGILS